MQQETRSAALRDGWWEAPEYHGELELPGQSRLDSEGRALLDELAGAVDAGALAIPPMPDVAMQIVRTMRRPDVELDEIAERIKLEPSLTAQVLRYANSSLFGARHTIDNVFHAASYLGMKRLKSVVLEAALRKMSGDLAAAAYARMEWSYSITAAAMSRHLGKKLGFDPETCYLAGLLHDIGRLPLLIALEKRGMLRSKPQGDDTVEIVVETLHRGVGRQVADAWELPPAIVDAIASHLTGRFADEDSLAQFDSTRVAEAAGDLCIAMGVGRHKRPFDLLAAPSFVQLGLQGASMALFLREDLPPILDEVSTLS